MVLVAAMLASVMLYLDRVCIAEVLKYDDVRNALGLGALDVELTYSAFFIAYAVSQVPSGWLADRFGARRAMTAYILGWSACTALTGAAAGFIGLFLLRLGVGAAQAGAYPTCGSLLSRWMPLDQRALGSSVVAFGGRVGGAIAPYLTSGLIAALAFVSPHSWRTVMAVYGALGAAAALGFWLVFRERPNEHPGCNEAERVLIARGRAAVGRPQARFPTRGLLASPGMWLMCLSQFTTNVGWAFLITKLPAYLNDVRKVEPQTGGAMATVVLLVGMAGMLLGGRLTDWTTARLGLRWGRTAILISSRFVAAAAFLAIAPAVSAWQATAMLAVVAFATDLGVAGTWAYMQDVGGKHVGAILGWGNMWGNFGAALSPPILGWIERRYDSNGDWNELFVVCSLAFVVSGVVSLGIDAAKPIQ